MTPDQPNQPAISPATDEEIAQRHNRGKSENEYWTFQQQLVERIRADEERHKREIAELMRVGGIAENTALRAELAASREECERLREALKGGPTPGPEFLDWIADRLVHVYGESPNVDFVLSLRERSAAARAALGAKS